MFVSQSPKLKKQVAGWVAGWAVWPAVFAALQEPFRRIHTERNPSSCT